MVHKAAIRIGSSVLSSTHMCIRGKLLLGYVSRRLTFPSSISSRVHSINSKFNRKHSLFAFGNIALRNIKCTKVRTFCFTPKLSIPNLCHTAAWLCVGSSFYSLCAKHIPGNILMKAVLCAKCEALCDVPLTSISASQAVLSEDKKSVLKWLFHDLIPLGFRAAQLFCFFTPMLITYPLTYLGPKWFETWLNVLYVAVEYSGATFIKLGQWASTRRDLFSKQVCDRFAHLHFQVRPHGWGHTAYILKEAYGECWQELLHLVEGQEPIGSGCIAQVYKGYISETSKESSLLKDDSDSQRQFNDSKDTTSAAGSNIIPVAIKVLHPSIQEKFHRDMILMSSAARFLTWLFPKLHWVNLNQCVLEFKSVMEAQLDMRQECLCLQKFTEDFASFDQIRVPRPFPNLVRHNILVETFEEGISVGKVVQDSSQPPELKIQLANIGVDIMLQMVFVNNFVHADLHPGNLLIQNMEKFSPEEQKYISPCLDDETLEDHGHVSKDPLRLVLLDCGITSSLEPEDRQKFQEVFTAVVKGEGETVADLFLSKSAVNNCKDPILFRKEMAQLVRDARQNLASISKIKVAEVMNAVFGVLSRHQIQLEANFATIVLAMAMLEGLGRSLNPDLDLLEKARPVLLGSYLSGKSAGA